MRKLKLVFGFAVLMASFYSCDKNSGNVSLEAESNLTDEQINELKAQTNTDFENSLFSQFNSSDYIFANNTTDTKDLALEKLNLTRLNSRMLRSSSAPVVYGPYVTTMPSSKIQTNYKIIISGQSGVATGVYFCDVYRYMTVITLPANSVGYPNSVTPEGFSNYTNQTPGYTYVSNSGSSEMTVASYKIIVKTNMLGQAVNKTLPASLNNINALSLSYSYVAL